MPSLSAMADYDEYLYSDFPYSETRPDRLATMAILFGMRPAQPDRCRVLELGCGLGGNLIGHATAYPDSTFLGIDRSARQVQVGLDHVGALGLQNIELRAMDILDFDPGPQRFDYIICHGIYSWVPKEVQARILGIMRECLRPHGVAYVSYNTLPGWHMRGMLRDMLRRQAGSTGTPEERIGRARSLLQLLGLVRAERSAAHAFLESEVQLLGQLGDEYLLYEHLVEHNQPVYFTDFAAACADAGLQYLTDAHLASALPGRLGPEALEAARGEDLIQTEQRLDLIDVRFFRRSLLCQKEARVDREKLGAGLRRLWVSTSLAPVNNALDLRSAAPEDFKGAGNKGVSADLPILKAALLALHENQPRGLAFRDLCAAAWTLLKGPGPRRAPRTAGEQLAASLLDLLVLGHIDLSLGTPAYVIAPGPRPRTTALARLQISRGRVGCTNLRHESISTDKLDRSLLRRLDGTRTWDELTTGVMEDLAAGELRIEADGQPITDRDSVAELVRQKLEHLARAAFLLE